MSGPLSPQRDGFLLPLESPSRDRFSLPGSPVPDAYSSAPPSPRSAEFIIPLSLQPRENGGSKRRSLLLHAAGLIFFYSLYGVLQEKIMKSSTYGPDNEHFTSSSLLIVVNRTFSVMVGVLILLFKSRQQPEAGSFASRIRPNSPLYAYASVAVFNFLSTTCQYQALRFVSYTTQSLAKTSKMIPVLVVGALVWKKKHLAREWIAASVILIGCATYLTSSPPTSHSHSAVTAVAQAVDASDIGTPWYHGLIGGALLVGYLFFDGLVSTTQEKVFGKNPKSADPFGPDSPVLDQMIWTNFFALLIALIMSLASIFTGSFWTNLELLFTSGSLIWDVCVFSAASAVGLIILLNTIASFGALTSSLIMTIRQFLSILLNAGIFGNFHSVSMIGWTGVFWVGSGIWIKMNKKYDQPKNKQAVFLPLTPNPDDHEDKSLLEKDSHDDEPTTTARVAPKEDRHRPKQYFMQYFVPVAVPVVCAAIFSVASNRASLPSEGFEGSRWGAELYEAMAPKCKTEITLKPYVSNTTTGFVTFPRSGNSYTRRLLERATGYETSSVYCDSALNPMFQGECNTELNFLIKTHYPALETLDDPDYYQRYDQVLHLVRNPFDAISSWYSYLHVPPKADGGGDHETKLNVTFGTEHQAEILDLARRWAEHASYWTQVPILVHPLRYEDLRARPVPHIMDLISFLLPDQDLPSLDEIVCVVEHHENMQAYHYKKHVDFSTWDQYEPDLRVEVLKVVRDEFCTYGYDHLLRGLLGNIPEMDGFCHGRQPALTIANAAS